MKTAVTIIGRSEYVGFPALGLEPIPARIDTGAKTSSIWASNIHLRQGALCFTLFDSSSEYFNGHEIETKSYETRVVASSNGMSEERYVVKLVVVLAGRRVRASFSLANRSTQAYPVLVGRNILRGKFLVDVKLGQPLTQAEKSRSQQLQSKLRDTKEQA